MFNGWNTNHGGWLTMAWMSQGSWYQHFDVTLFFLFFDSWYQTWTQVNGRFCFLFCFLANTGHIKSILRWFHISGLMTASMFYILACSLEQSDLKDWHLNVTPRTNMILFYKWVDLFICEVRFEKTQYHWSIKQSQETSLYSEWL